MEHILDNPAWNALISGNKHLSNGNNVAKYFPPVVSPFAGLIENNPKNFKALYEIFPYDNPIGICIIDELSVPEQWTIAQRITGFQMIYQHLELEFVEKAEIVSLTEAHVPEMLKLTQLTKPGPFAGRTIDFGNYQGIFEEDRLVAMAGRRLHCFNYIEISAVCTHPDHLGRGYARQLLQSQIQSILIEGCIPYLHVRDDNTRAIHLYKQLGFETRTGVSFYMLEKNSK